jgi:hypothetical protein
MMREVTRRYVNCLTDAGARDVDAGQTYRFQDNFLKKGNTNTKATNRFREVA